MITTDENALICDLAETYGIYEYESLSPIRIAALSVGLRENSRIKMIMQGMNCPLDTVLLASIVDRLSILVWMNTRDGMNGRNRPKSVLESLLGTEKELAGFDSVEEYEAARKEIMEGGAR